jgi:TIR domain
VGKFVFLSYAHEDAQAVDQLQAALEMAGIQVWRDRTQLWPGEDWQHKIRSAIIDDALIFVACFSKRSLTRRTSYQNEELTLALDELRRRRPDVPWLIPVRLDDCEIPDLALGAGRTLRSLQRVDLFGERREAEAARLVTTITRMLGLPEGPLVTPVVASAPTEGHGDGLSRVTAGRSDLESHISQRARAADRAKIVQVGRDQVNVNLGNILWLIVPVLLVVVGLVVYLIVVPANASRSPGSAGGKSGPRARTTAPLAVALSYDKRHVDNGPIECMNWLFRKPLSAISAPPSISNIDETWAHQNGGIDQGTTYFKITVQGLTSSAVQLIDFRVVDLKRSPAFDGTDIVASCGGPSSEAGFAVFLGRNPPAVTQLPGLDGRSAKAIPFPFRVSSEDIQQFQIGAFDLVKNYRKPGQGVCDCLMSWRLALDWTYKGKTGTTVIDDDGRPFQTLFLPLSRSVDTAWSDGSGHWGRL